MAKYKVRCKVCKAVATIDTDNKTFDIDYPAETSPYGGNFSHATMMECPLTQGLEPEQLVEDSRVEAL